MSAPRRIAIVTHDCAVPGGVESIALWLRDGLSATGGYVADVHYLATSSRDGRSRRVVAPSSWLRRSLTEGGHAGRGESRWGANAVELEPMRYRPRRELTSALAGYDVIQLVVGSPVWGLTTAGAGVPVVMQVATRIGWERPVQLIGQPVLPRTWRRAMTALVGRFEASGLLAVDTVLVENEAMLSWAASVGHPSARKAMPGVDTVRFSPGPLGHRPDGHLLSVCRLNDPRKGLRRLVDAYAQLARRRPSVPPLVIAGSGAPSPDLRGRISELGLDAAVMILSDVAPDDLVELYRGASVFLQSSWEEGLGMSVIEAMACGLPIVATETAGSRETVAHGENGWLVPQDPESEVPVALADRTLRVLSTGYDAFCAHSRARCQRLFSSEAALRHFTDAYDELLAPDRAQPVRALR
ncbi:glycosyltransferase family 4 protein [Luedemannella helvata]|uniref:Glycosyltransferase n=1 Tax=Luedemannella helvata TaxID=349315 RepID=A0ABP4XCH9_9ACTN